MSASRRIITWREVSYRRNADLGIDLNCHECTSHKFDESGYPRCNVGGFKRVHRLVYFQKTGERPDEVMHTCDNPSCINPDHLVGGTHSENMQDMKVKGRRKMKCTGEKHGSAKISESEARDIFSLKDSGRSYADIGREYSISDVQASNIINKRSWRCLHEIS